MSNPSIIFLNGTSSSGKTSLAHALQRRLKMLYMHVSIDGFGQMFPEEVEEPISPETVAMIQTNLIAGFHRCLGTLAYTNNYVIADHVLQESEWWSECAHILADVSVLLVQVWCPLEELERREVARGDRKTGMVRRQFDKVYGPGIYDVMVDTSQISSNEGAEVVLEHIRSGLPYRGFRDVSV
ncbi:MAG: AAA family ATPase [Chloroflexota bacterium]